MMRSTMKTRSAVVSALATVMLAGLGCGTKYSTRYVKQQSLPRHSAVALSVFSAEDNGSAPTVLEAYMTAALMGRGYKVHTLKLELLLGKDVLRRTLCTMCKGATSGGGGGLFGKVTGGGSSKCKLRSSVDTNVSPKRFNSLFELLSASKEKLKIRYHVVVHKFDTYGYAVYVVDRTTEQVLMAYVVSANSKGFGVAVEEPNKGDHREAKDGDVTNLHYLRLAEHIVRKM